MKTSNLKLFHFLVWFFGMMVISGLLFIALVRTNGSTMVKTVVLISQSQYWGILLLILACLLMQKTSETVALGWRVFGIVIGLFFNAIMIISFTDLLHTIRMNTFEYLETMNTFVLIMGFFMGAIITIVHDENLTRGRWLLWLNALIWIGSGIYLFTRIILLNTDMASQMYSGFSMANKKDMLLAVGFVYIGYWLVILSNHITPLVPPKSADGLMILLLVTAILYNCALTTLFGYLTFINRWNAVLTASLGFWFSVSTIFLRAFVNGVHKIPGVTTRVQQ